MAKMRKIYHYSWEGNSKTGRKLSGELAAVNPAYVKAKLRRENITPLKVYKKRARLFIQQKKIKAAEISALTRQIATMLQAGIPILLAFDLVGRGHVNLRVQQLLAVIKRDVESGLTFAEALGKHPTYFNNLYCNLVSVGEQSGSLDIILTRVATYKEKIESLKKKIKKVLFYPIAVLMIALCISVILLVFVVPQFESLFSSFDAELPVMTQVVMQLAKTIRSYGWIFLSGLVGVIWALRFAGERFLTFRGFIDKYSLRLPIIGSILQNAIIALFTRTLATTYAAGIPLSEAIKAVAGTSGNIIYSNAALTIHNKISTGQSLQTAMQATKLFPNKVLQMVAVGEESGTLEKMLIKAADFYEEDVENDVDALSSLLEPLIMVILSFLVGGLVIAMYLPIFKLGNIV